MHAPSAATRDILPPNRTESPADAAGGSRGTGVSVEGLPAGHVAITDAMPGTSIIDVSAHVVTIGALRQWLVRWSKRIDKEPARQAAAIREWLAGQRYQERRIPYRLWCDMEVARLKRIGRAARVYTIPGTDLCAVVTVGGEE